MSVLIFAPVGIGEVIAGDDVGELVCAAVAADRLGPLRSGDIIVVTSKILSKAEGRRVPADQRGAALAAETVRTVAARLVPDSGAHRSNADRPDSALAGSQPAVAGPICAPLIVENRIGVVQAAAGIDASNVASGEILLLPLDPDASAVRIRERIAELAGVAVGVIVSDTAGRAWRIGQTDHAIGLAGVVGLLDYAGRTDAYGNELKVTQMAVADELAAAADLVKSKLGATPVAVVRGLAHLVDKDAPGAGVLQRPPASDLFAVGTREAVLQAVLHALGRADDYERLVRTDPERVADELTAALAPQRRAGLGGFVRALLTQPWNGRRASAPAQADEPAQE